MHLHPSKDSAIYRDSPSSLTLKRIPLKQYSMTPWKCLSVLLQIIISNSFDCFAFPIMSRYTGLGASFFECRQILASYAFFSAHSRSSKYFETSFPVFYMLVRTNPFSSYNAPMFFSFLKRMQVANAIFSSPPCFSCTTF
mgnify:CR=1 FL=1